MENIFCKYGFPSSFLGKIKERYPLLDHIFASSNKRSLIPDFNLNCEPKSPTLQKGRILFERDPTETSVRAFLSLAMKKYKTT